MKALLRRLDKLEVSIHGHTAFYGQWAFNRALEDSGLTPEEYAAVLADFRRLESLSLQGIDAEPEPITDRYLDALEFYYEKLGQARQTRK